METTGVEPETSAGAVELPHCPTALRNATVGRPYEMGTETLVQAIAASRGDNPEVARISKLELPEGGGLEFDAATGLVSGTPNIPFEGVLTLDYLPNENLPVVSFAINLLVNPDPATLWKDLPTPAGAPYQKENTANSVIEEGMFRVVAASRRGRSHANKGEFRDDEYAVAFAREFGWMIVAVADGAGSAKYSRRGSEIACETAVARLTAVLNSADHNLVESLYKTHSDWQHSDVRSALRRILYEAALSAHHKLRDEVSNPTNSFQEPPTLRNFDTTLILLAMKKSDSGWVAATFSIGDGGAGLLKTPEAGFPIILPEAGEHAGQTTFLTLPGTLRDDEDNLASRFQMFVIQEFAGALVMTDGISDPIFPSEASYSDPTKWSALWVELQPALSDSEALLEWTNFLSPGNHDDRTLVAVLPSSSPAPQ